MKRLFSHQPVKKDELETISLLLNAWGNPQNSYPTIHVAGTNGKGSVTTKIARGFEAAGYRVGLFISPHLFNYEERISINKEYISRKTVALYDEELEKEVKRLNLDPNFFEYTTCFGFRYFKEQNVDIALIETGIGGLYDVTNVIVPKMSVITSIGFDHVDFLGDTLEKIAAQKAGIIKPHVPVVVGPRVRFSVIEEKAKEMDAPLLLVEDKSEFFEIENRSIARKALEYFSIDEKAIVKGLNAGLACRFEKRGNLIFDVAHNSEGFSRLRDALQYFYPSQKFRFVLGMFYNKDHLPSLKYIADIASHIHFVRENKVGGVSIEDLGKLFQQISNAPYTLELGVKKGLENAQKNATKDELIIVCGSCYIMSEALEGVNYAWSETTLEERSTSQSIQSLPAAISRMITGESEKISSLLRCE